MDGWMGREGEMERERGREQESERESSDLFKAYTYNACVF